MLALFFGHGTIDDWLSTYGYAVVFLMIAIESLGIPVPGETTLIAAALYAGSTHHLTIEWIVAVAAAGAIAGDNVGFAIGRYGGARLLLRYGHKVRLDAARLKLGIWVFRRHGGKVVFFGRFVSVLRTYAAFLAGTNRMGWSRFLAFNAAGGVVWATIYGVGYYVFGSVLDELSTALDIALAVAAALAVVVFVIWLRRKEESLQSLADQELEGSVEEELGVVPADR